MGAIESISTPDVDGNVVAKISHAFEIIPPIRQGDSFLEAFVWDSKKKVKGSWEHVVHFFANKTLQKTLDK